MSTPPSPLVTLNDLNNTAQNLNNNIIATGNNLQENQNFLQQQILDDVKSLEVLEEIVDNTILQNNAINDPYGNYLNQLNASVIVTYQTGPFFKAGQNYTLGTTFFNNNYLNSINNVPSLRSIETGFNHDKFIELWSNFKDTSFLVNPNSNDGVFHVANSDFSGTIFAPFYGSPMYSDKDNIVSVFTYTDAVNQVWEKIGIKNDNTANFVTAVFAEKGATPDKGSKFWSLIIFAGPIIPFLKENSNSIIYYFSGKTETVPGDNPDGPTSHIVLLEFDFVGNLVYFDPSEYELAVTLVNTAPNAYGFVHTWGDTRLLLKEIINNASDKSRWFINWWSIQYGIDETYSGLNVLLPANPDTLISVNPNYERMLKLYNINKYDPIVMMGVVTGLLHMHIMINAGILPSKSSVLEQAQTGKITDADLENIFGDPAVTLETLFGTGATMTEGYNLNQCYLLQLP